MSRFLSALGAVAILTLLARSPAEAHARVARADPAPGSTVTMAPGAVRIWFKLDPNEELDPKRSTLSVWDAHGRRVDDGKGGVDLNDLNRLSMIVHLKPLGAGTYTVRWKAVSTPDLGVRQGTFRFTVAMFSSLPALKIVSPLNGSTMENPVVVIFQTAADLAKMTMGASGMKTGMAMGGTHLHIDIDRRMTMPTMKQNTSVGKQRYQVNMGRVAPGRHTIRLYWADAKHHPMGPVQSASVTVK